MKKKILKKALVAVASSIVGCCFFAGCRLSTDVSVTYVVDGETYKVQDYEVDATIALPEPPTKEGYTFIGWYTDEALTIPYAEGKITEGITLYAKFSESSVYIVINTSGGEKIEAIEVLPGAAYEIPEAVKEGYTFIGYTYVDDNGEEQDFPLTGTYPSNVGIRITAKYEINKYQVTFVGKEESMQEVEYNKTAIEPSTTKAGYTFEGWYTSATEQTEATKFDLATGIKANTTLYAKYTPNQYTIRILANGGAFANASDASVAVAYNSAYSLAEPTMEGYTFAGYKVNGADFAISGTYTNVGDITLMATWTKNQYTVTWKDFDTNATLKTETVEHGNKVTAPAAQTGYEYVGAFKEDKTTPINVAQQGIVGNTVIYAKYVAKTFTITVNGAQAGYTNPTVQYGAAYELVIPDRGANYEFVKFVKDGVEFPATGTYTWTENIAVEVVWDGVGKDIMFYDGVNELTSLRIETEYGADMTAITLPAVPQKTGYTTDGKWYVDAACTEEFVASGAVEADVHLYAKYTANPYKIYIFDTQEAIDVTYDGEYELPTNLTKEGYIFDGYKLVNGAEFATTGKYTVEGDTTVYANWIEDQIKVYFVVGGNQVQEQTILRGQTATFGEDPTKTGYSFNGWYTSDETQDDSTKVTANTKFTANNNYLYAGFTANQYTVTFKVWDSATKTIKDVAVVVTYGQAIANVPEHATRESYDFKGYIYNGAAFDPTKPYTYDTGITVEEKWDLKDNASLFEYNSSANYFTEREDYDADWTYVYLIGETYTFAESMTLTMITPGGEAFATVNGNALTANAVGTFVVEVNNNGNVYTRTIKTVEYIRSFSLGGTTYDTAWGLTQDGTDYKRNSTDVWDKKVAVSAGEAMKVGKANFIPEININSKIAAFDPANINVMVTLDGQAVTDYNVVNGAINFGSSLVGKKVSVILTPKYKVNENHKAVYNVEVNNAVNVYTNEELKANFANASVTEINILRDIKVELSADQVNTTTVNGYTIVSPKNNNVNGTPDTATGVYTRRSGNMKINGNYFTVDGSNIPLLDARVEEKDLYHEKNTGYIIFDNRFSIFLFGTRYANSTDTLTMDNVNIKGNGALDAAMGYSYKDKTVLQYSGAAVGIGIGSGKVNMDNVTARFCSFGIIADSVATFMRNGVACNAISIYAKDCKLENNWANNIYIDGGVETTLDSCYIGVANGASVHIDARNSAHEVDAQINLLNGTDIQNWVTGQEAWFNAQGLGVAIPTIKDMAGNAVQQFSGGKADAGGTFSGGAKTIVSKEGKVNFAILVQKRGDAGDWNLGPVTDPNDEHDMLGPTFMQTNTDEAYRNYVKANYSGFESVSHNFNVLDLSYVTYMQNNIGSYGNGALLMAYAQERVMSCQFAKMSNGSFGVEVFVGIADNV